MLSGLFPDALYSRHFLEFCGLIHYKLYNSNLFTWDIPFSTNTPPQWAMQGLHPNGRKMGLLTFSIVSTLSLDPSSDEKEAFSSQLHRQS